MARDQDRLRRRLDRARGLKDRAARQAVLDEVAAAVAEAEQRVANRRAGVPVPRYPATLPVSVRKDEIAAAIAAHPVVIVAGETGSGKSTQLPKICLEVGRGVRGMIGHTQPRRLAARAVAERVAEELGGEVGQAVGYAVRFTDRVSRQTLVKVMTDGILLNEIQRDRLLTAYDTIIVDEAHERSLNIDFILGYLKQLLPRRPDLKVIVTSATIDTERFARHFGGAPIVEVSGRTYPVEVRYRPLVDLDAAADDAEGADERDQIQAISEAVTELVAGGPGDILVFLSGEREIRDTAEALAALALPDTELLPLYARLSAAEQHRVFQPHPGRRIVLATNVAETSLTVPGILAVVDPGTARISRYSHRTKVQRLPIEPVSQASANQRAGRCGRVAPGVCIRLYSETDFRSRPEFTEPEIVRTNLASVILQMAALGLGDVARFPFVDAPDARAIKDGVALLEELGALDPAETNPKKRLTPLGRRLAQLPLDPRLGRMVLEGEANGVVDEVMVIAAALSIQDPRERPLDKQAAADEAHARFADKESDFLAYLKLWDHLAERQEALSSNQFRKLCRAEFLNFLRIREWQDIHGQLRQVLRDRETSRLDDEQKRRKAIHQSLLAGLLSHVGMKSGQRDEYQGARAARFAIAPGSVLYKTSAGWVMAAELVETTRLWARVVARIEPEWAERLGAHLVKRSYSEPHWDAKRGEAMAYERVTLYGLPVVSARRISYNRVDPAAARDLFIRLALVEGDWHTPHPFWEENRRLVEEIRSLARRVRRSDVLVDDDVLIDFYDRRIGREVTSSRSFDGWWKRERVKHPDLLRFTRELLINPAVGPLDAGAFPDVWHYRNLELRLSYEFDPGSEADGVTVHVPLPVLDQLGPEPFDWQVPGLRADVVAALIRSLPKEVRRSFVPVPDYAAQALQRIRPDHGPLPEVLARELGRLTGDPVPPGSWRWDRVPPHLRMRYLVEDEAGRELAAGKDLRTLQEQLAERAEAGLAVAASTFEQDGLRSWTIGTLPRQVDVTWAGFRRRAYPALVDRGESVAVRVLASPAEQDREMWAGTRRLLLLSLPNPTRAAERRLSNDTQLALARSPYRKVSDLFDDCVECAVDQLLADLGGPVWNEAAFNALRTGVSHALTESVVYVVTVVAGILAIANGIEMRLSGLRAPSLAPSLTDIERQLHRLVRPGFIAATGVARLPDLMRYLEGIERRLDKLPTGADRDFDNLRRVQRLERRYGELLGALGPAAADQDVEAIGWMIEELRISYFAQGLGTAQPVSEKRILREIDRWWSEAG
jgi:ATP-dependent helicase HrpA